MAKRSTGVGSKRPDRPHKTAKRAAAKKIMLAEKAGKKMRHTRKISPTKYA